MNFEIIDNTNDKEIIDIKDIMDIKEIKLDNKNLNKANYIIVLEETDDYRKHKVTKRLSNEYINYNTANRSIHFNLQCTYLEEDYDENKKSIIFGNLNYNNLKYLISFTVAT